MLEFAEQEIVLPPGGPFAERPFRADRNPWAGLFLQEWDRLKPTYTYVCGDVQDGKTFTCTVVPTLYCLFELQEPVIVGAPDLNMVADKWAKDFLPVIKASPRLARWLPRNGKGTKDGTAAINVTFTNGTWLRFMTSHGGDKSVAGATVKNLIATEINDFAMIRGGKGGRIVADQSAAGKEQIPKWKQLLARTDAHGERRRVFGECTVAGEFCLIWKLLKDGSDARIMPQCQHCLKWVEVDREHLGGWEDAATAEEAAAKAYFFCAECGSHWSEADRRKAIENARLVHRGQSVDEQGNVIGEVPGNGRVFSLRFHAGVSLLKSTRDIAFKEFEAAKEPDQKAAMREVYQLTWSRPAPEEHVEIVRLEQNVLTLRQGPTEHLIVPAWAERLTLTADMGRNRMHWVSVAWKLNGRGRIVAYGTLPVPSNSMPEQLAFREAIINLHEARIKSGLLCEDGSTRRFDAILIDANYCPAGVVEGIQYINQQRTAEDIRFKRFAFPYFGIGVEQYARQDVRHKYNQPKSTGAHVAWIGVNTHIAMMPKYGGIAAVEADVTPFKCDLHAALALTPADPKHDPELPAGAIDLHKVDHPSKHNAFVKQLLAEVMEQGFELGKFGPEIKLRQVSENNHWLDSTASNLPASQLCGVSVLVKLAGQPAGGPIVVPARVEAETEEQRPFLVTARDNHGEVR